MPSARKGDDSPNYLVVDEDRAPLVPVIFELYAHKRMGAHGIAAWLNDGGHRTRVGRLWSHTARRAAQPGLPGRSTSAAAGTATPTPRWSMPSSSRSRAASSPSGERTNSRRASNASDYLLSGLVTCAKCRHHFTGTAAHERSATYRYYTCFSRQHLRDQDL
ncbi:MAG TPA: recombinase zinc beta ribbon domain-containing protein [Acidimicrobiales bacterium]|nr:recombinase zinc beta ribbon domain-containing protein [Acidimicrobiales bacterium]